MNDKPVEVTVHKLGRRHMIVELKLAAKVEKTCLKPNSKATGLPESEKLSRCRSILCLIQPCLRGALKRAAKITLKLARG